MYIVFVSLQLNDEQDLKDQDNVDYEEDDPVLEDNYDDEEEDRNAQIEERHQIQAPSSLTEYKWKHYGTRSKVEESRRHQLHLQSGNTNCKSLYVCFKLQVGTY